MSSQADEITQIDGLNLIKECSMKFKKLLSALAVASAFVAGASQAAPIVIDVNQWDPTPVVGTDGKTAPISFLGLNWSATSVYTDTNGSGTLNTGDLVLDSGAGSVSYLNAGNALILGPENNEGYGFTHSLVFDYSNLVGVVAVNDGAGGIGAFYGAGDIFLRGDTDADGVGDVLLMTLGVLGSTGTIGNFTLFTKVTSVADDVFFYNGLYDFADLLINLQVVVGSANFNNLPLVPGDLGGDPLQWSRTTTLNGNLSFNVPEPGVLALLGLGLAGLGFARRNKKTA